MIITESTKYLFFRRGITTSSPEQNVVLNLMFLKQNQSTINEL